VAVFGLVIARIITILASETTRSERKSLDIPFWEAVRLVRKDLDIHHGKGLND